MFRALIEANGFSAAAERLGTTHSTVSRQLAQLEAKLGARLVNRSTRRIMLTACGERYHAACIDILDRLDAASQAISGESERPAGVLRISAPLVIGTLELARWLPAFQQRYPEIRIDLSCDDQFVDLIAGRFDVALRISEPLADTSLVARTLAVSDRVLVASRAYVNQNGLPKNPAELEWHRLLGFSGGSDHGKWSLAPNRGDPVQVSLGDYLKVDAVTTLHAAVMAGIGIAAFTHATVCGDLAQGNLVRILPGYTLGKRHYYALYPHARHLPTKVRAFIDHMVEHYRTSGQSHPVRKRTSSASGRSRASESSRRS